MDTTDIVAGMRGLIVAALFCSILSGCTSGGGGNSTSNNSDPAPENPSFGQALLGPLVNASVEVYSLSGLAGAPVYTTTTTDSAVLDEAGLFTVPAALVDSAEVYLVTISGGLDIDADDDGILDAVPTTNNGTIHGILTPEQILAGNYRVTVLSEVVYQSMRYLLSSTSSKTTIVAEVNRLASVLLSTDIDSDGDIDADDMVAWNPRTDGGAVVGGMAAYTAITASIHNNEDVALAALSLADTENGAVATPGTSFDVAVSPNNIAYVADGASGLQIVDVSDPAAPFIIGSLATIEARTVAINADGSTVVVADDAGGVVVVNVSAPSAPTVLSTLPAVQPAEDVTIVGNLAYVAVGEQVADGTLTIVDLTNPAAPVVVGSVIVPGWVNGVEVSGGYAYVSGYFEGVYIVDVSNPANPAIVSSIPSMGEANDVVVDGSYLYVADGIYAITTYDITNPLTPIQVAVYGAPNEYTRVVKHGNLLFVRDAIAGIEVIDVSDPATPTSAGVIARAQTADGIAISNGRLYVADWSGGLLIFSAVAPGLPPMLGSTWQLPNVPWAASFFDNITLVGNHLYCTASFNGFQVYDVSDLSNPTLVSTLDFGGIDEGLYIVGSTAYLTNYSNGLRIVDITNQAAPVSVNNFPLPKAQKVIVAGDYAYITQGGTNLIKILNISDPLNIVDVGDFSGKVRDWKVSGSYLYVAESFADRLAVYDISNPASPVLSAIYPTPNSPFSLDIVNSVLYLAVLDNGLHIIDISDPLNMSLISSATATANLSDIVVVNGIAYASARLDGVFIYDVVSPTTPVLSNIISTRESANEVLVSNGAIFISDGIYGLQISAHPQLVLP